MRTIPLFIVLLLGLFQETALTQDLDGVWQGKLKSPGGDLEFDLIVKSQKDVRSAFLQNGPEQIKIPVVKWTQESLRLEIPHYDSQMVAEFDEDSNSYLGFWQKTRGKDNAPKMELTISRPVKQELGSFDAFLGDWQVNFSSSEDPAIAMIRSLERDNNLCQATFRTTTGDYRFLTGKVTDKVLHLSVFDGAHAFLFHATLNEDGTLVGDFWSSLTWHETWTATKGLSELPDAFLQTRFDDSSDLDEFKFPDLEGKPTSINDPAFTGRPRLVQVFGSWCPNCNDAEIYLRELSEKYGDDLSILGLAFELTGDFERDAEQVKEFLEHHGTNFPVLIAGVADKKLASQKIPFLDRVRSYPTTIFINAEGEVVAVHTGFEGPATGEAYENLKRKFESRIDAMIEDWKD